MTSTLQQTNRVGRASAAVRESHHALSPLAETRLRRRLRAAAPSEPWVDAQIVSREQASAEGRVVVRRFFEPGVFPPGGRAGTGMRWCRECGRYVPGYAVRVIERVRDGSADSATLRCDECRADDEAAGHAELYEALPHLRPAGSVAFCRMAELLAGRNSAR